MRWFLLPGMGATDGMYNGLQHKLGFKVNFLNGLNIAVRKRTQTWLGESSRKTIFTVMTLWVDLRSGARLLLRSEVKRNEP